jgi:transposase-like protein
MISKVDQAGQGSAMVDFDCSASTDLSLVSVARMSDEEARKALMALRWPSSNGRPICPRCSHNEVYFRKSRRTFLCKRCVKDFSIISGTIFAFSKVSAKDLILAACLFVGGAKGVSGLQLSRYMGRQYKSSFVLAHKMREAMQRPDLGLHGVVQVDGCTIGGYRLASNAVGEYGKRYYQKKYGNRRVVVVAREPFGNTKAFVGKKESDSLGAVSETLAPDTIIQADGSRAWNSLARQFDLMRVEHDKAYSEDGAHTNWAESYFALLRKMQYGIHHKIGAQYLEAYANELAWRQDNREMKESEKIKVLLTRCLNMPPSQRWSKYWQRRKMSGACASDVVPPAASA